MSLLLLLKPLRTPPHGGGIKKGAKRSGRKKKKEEKLVITRTAKGLEIKDTNGHKIQIDSELAEGILLFLMMDDDNA